MCDISSQPDNHGFVSFKRLCFFRNPTQTQILGLHFEMARDGLLKYLSLNTTFNSSIQLNYRQTESAFWTWYLPTVVGYLVPTYPPSTEVGLYFLSSLSFVENFINI